MKLIATFFLALTLALVAVGCGESDPADTSVGADAPDRVNQDAQSPSAPRPDSDAADKFAQIVVGQTLEEVEEILGPADSTMGTTERVMRFWTKPNDDEFSVLFVDGVVEEVKTLAMP
ncbi:MAG: hypothetical protein AAGA29_10905 [Planctomycetota bacterium]